MKRKNTRKIMLGGIEVGGGSPITVQSMTNTKSDNVSETVQQINRLAAAGCDIVRIAVPDMAAANAIGAIKQVVTVPLVADIHFDYRLALAAIEQGIDALRLNPGNIGGREQIEKVVRLAKQREIPIRIGVNAGSFEKSLLEKYNGHPTPEAMVESALQHVRILEELDFSAIKISLKANDVPMTIKAYELISQAVSYPLHLGITEAGTRTSGIIKSAVGIGALLAGGIGDTLRISLTGDPVEEVRVAKEILQALNLRTYGPTLISCPTCGRCNINLSEITEKVEAYLATISAPLKVAVMGCAVNGPGEAKEADIGIAGGQGEGLVFKKGVIIKKVQENEIVDTLITEIALMNVL